MKHYLIPFVALLVATSAVSAQTPNDAQIAAIVVAANQVDVDAGRLAASKGNDERVRNFGKLMMNDHTGVNQAAAELVGRLGVTPEASPTSRELQDGGAKNVARLENLTGKAFDVSYIDHEVAYHEQVLEALDQVLIPNAHNDELKALLVKVRPAFVAHLEHAKQLQSDLGSH